jgi:hypothetical protein
MDDLGHRILTFEKKRWRHAGAKEAAIRAEFDMSAVAYYGSYPTPSRHWPNRCSSGDYGACAIELVSARAGLRRPPLTFGLRCPHDLWGEYARRRPITTSQGIGAAAR